MGMHDSGAEWAMDSARAWRLTVGETVREEGLSPVNRWFYGDQENLYDVTTLAGAQRPGRRAPPDARETGRRRL